MNHSVQDGRRTRHEARRPDLLDAAADYVLAHGLTDLSIRPLASALGISHRSLLYHFGSKDELLLEIVQLIRRRDGERIRAHLAAARITTGMDLLRSAWAFFSAPEREDYMRVLHELLVLGLSRAPYDQWLQEMADSRVGLVSAGLQRMGYPAARARAAATLVVASVRGLQIQLLATGDREVVDAAIEELITAIELGARGETETDPQTNSEEA